MEQSEEALVAGLLDAQTKAEALFADIQARNVIRPGAKENEINESVYALAVTSANVRGVNLDAQTRCEHYHGPTDIVAIKMKCCGVYYACKDCHATLADHEIEVWPEMEWNQQAILCGACGTELTIRQYMECESCCLVCHEPFNPGCRNHYHFYFKIVIT